MASNRMKMLIIVILFMGLETSLSAPLEEAKFLRQIVDQYSPPLIISFLHSRMHNNQQIIKKIKNSLTGLDESKRDVFDAAEMTLQLLDNQLIVLEKADYFEHDGTEKVKYFIEQFIMVNEFYPIDFSSYGMIDIGLTVDEILEQLKTQTFDKLFNQTNTLIENYLSAIEGQSLGVNCNHLQKLSAYVAKIELQSLINHLYIIKTTNYNNNGQNYNNYNNQNNGNDPRKDEVEKVLRKTKIIIDFFYSQFKHLADQQSVTTLQPTITRTDHPTTNQQQFNNQTISADIYTGIEVVTGASTYGYPYFN